LDVNTVSSKDYRDFFSLFENYIYIVLFIFFVIYIFIYFNYYYGKLYFSLVNIYNYVEIWYDKPILPIMLGKLEEPKCIYKCKCLKTIFCPFSNSYYFLKIDIKEGKELSEEDITRLKINKNYIKDIIILKGKHCKERTTDCIEKPNDNKIKYCPKCNYTFK
jgi:hypothetical protein